MKRIRLFFFPYCASENNPVDGSEWEEGLWDRQVKLGCTNFCTTLYTVYWKICFCFSVLYFGCGPITLRNGFHHPQQRLHSHDAVVSYSCIVGMKPLTGTWWGTTTCKNGKWSPVPRCIGESFTLFEPTRYRSRFVCWTLRCTDLLHVALWIDHWCVATWSELQVSLCKLPTMHCELF